MSQPCQFFVFERPDSEAYHIRGKALEWKHVIGQLEQVTITQGERQERVKCLFFHLHLGMLQAFYVAHERLDDSNNRTSGHYCLGFHEMGKGKIFIFTD